MLVARYREGAKVKELAREFGISRDTVCTHLNQQGVERPVRGLRSNQVPAAVKLYQAGWSLARIAEKFKVHAMTVRRRLMDAGVRMRDTCGRER